MGYLDCDTVWKEQVSFSLNDLKEVKLTGSIVQQRRHHRIPALRQCPFQYNNPTKNYLHHEFKGRTKISDRYLEQTLTYTFTFTFDYISG